VGEEDDSKPGRGVPVKRGAHPNAVINHKSPEDLYIKDQIIIIKKNRQPFYVSSGNFAEDL